MQFHIILQLNKNACKNHTIWNADIKQIKPVQNLSKDIY